MLLLIFLRVVMPKKRITERIISIANKSRTQIFLLGNPRGEENPTKFLDIDFNQVQCKTQEIRLDNFLFLRWIVYPLYSELA